MTAPQGPSAPQPPRLPQAPRVARRWAQYVLAFGVSVAVGLAPYLGKIHVPGFAPLLSTIPTALHDVLIPLSAAVMGILAVVVQWMADDHPTERWLRKMFGRVLLVLVLSLVSLIVVETMAVVRVDILGGKDFETFQVGFSRPLRHPCTADVSDAECIKKLTLDRALIESFWGDKQVRIARLCLIFSYLTFTGGFGALVGLLTLRSARVAPAVR